MENLKVDHDFNNKTAADMSIASEEFIEGNSNLKQLIFDFLSNPAEKKYIELLISAAHQEPFPIFQEFFAILIDSISQESTDNLPLCLHLLEVFLTFPLSCFNFQLPIGLIIEKVQPFFPFFPDAISIATLFLQQRIILTEFGIDQMYIQLEIPQKVFSSFHLENFDISIQVLRFFRYFVKTKIAFLPDYRCIYDQLYMMCLREETPLQDGCIHTLYHFIKQDIKMFKDRLKSKKKMNKRKKHEVALDLPYSYLFENVERFQNNNPLFHSYLLKIFRCILRIKSICRHHFETIQIILPYINFILNTSLTNDIFDSNPISIALCCLYNFVYDARKRAADELTKTCLIDLLFQIYETSGYQIKREVLYIFIEYSRYADMEVMAAIYQKYDIIHIFVHLLSHDDPTLCGDLFLSLLDLFDNIESSGQFNFMYQYFFNQEFVEAIAEVGPGAHYYPEFSEKLMAKIENEGTAG